MHPGDTMGVYPMSSTLEAWSLIGGIGNTFAGYLVARYDDPNYVPPVAVPATAAPTAAPSPSSATPTF